MAIECTCYHPLNGAEYPMHDEDCAVNRISEKKFDGQTSKRDEAFDLEDVYDDEINPLMAQIIEVCKNSGMQMVASFCYVLDEDGVRGHCTTKLPGNSRTLNLAGALIERGVDEGETVKIGSRDFSITVVKTADLSED